MKDKKQAILRMSLAAVGILALIAAGMTLWNPPAMGAGAEFIPQTQHDFRQVHKPERIEAKTHNTG